MDHEFDEILRSMKRLLNKNVELTQIEETTTSESFKDDSEVVRDGINSAYAIIDRVRYDIPENDISVAYRTLV